MEISVKKSAESNKAVVSVKQCANCGRILTKENTSKFGSDHVCDGCYVGYFDGPDVVDD